MHSLATSNLRRRNRLQPSSGPERNDQSGVAVSVKHATVYGFTTAFSPDAST